MAKSRVKPKKKTTKKRKRQDEDTRQRKKFAKGGRVEAYTFGEASRGKGFPW